MTTQTQDNAPAQDGSSPPDDLDAFDAALAEIEDNGSDAPADDAAAQGGDSDQGSDTSADQNAAPADKAAVNEAPASNASPADNPTDIWANAPAELREAHERTVRDLDLKYRSAAARQTALQQKLAEQVQQQGGNAEDQAKAKDGASKGITDRLAELREDFPDLAPLIDSIEELAKNKEETEQIVQTVQQDKADAFIAQQEGILAQQHPDWMDAAKDERFMGWLETQPTSLKQAMERNFHAIVDGADAALVIAKFKADMGVQNFGAKAAQPAKPDPQQERRQRQLSANRDTRRPGGPATTQGFDPDDFDGVVNALADKM